MGVSARVFQIIVGFYFMKNMLSLGSQFRPHFLNTYPYKNGGYKGSVNNNGKCLGSLLQKNRSYQCFDIRNISSCYILNLNPTMVTIPIPIPIPRSLEKDDPFMSKKRIHGIAQTSRKPPLCSNCKHYVPFKKALSFNKDEYEAGFGLCKMFGSKFDLIQFCFAKHCRDNEHQCGKFGYCYEGKDDSYSSQHLYESSGIVKNETMKPAENEEEIYNQTIENRAKNQGEKETGGDNPISSDFILIKSEKKDIKPNNWEELKERNPQLYEYSKFLFQSYDEKKDL